MSLSGIGSGASRLLPLRQQRDRFSQSREGFGALTSAVPSGGIGAPPPPTSPRQDGQGRSSSSNSTDASFTSDFTSLLDAVRSGDMSSAQNALATMRTDVSTSSTATYGPKGTTSSTGGLTDDVQSLVDAVQSGDLETAQQALGKLQDDLAEVVGDDEASPSIGGRGGPRGPRGPHGPHGPPPAANEEEDDDDDDDLYGIDDTTSTDSTTSTTSITATATGDELKTLVQAVESNDSTTAPPPGPPPNARDLAYSAAMLLRTARTARATSMTA